MTDENKIIKDGTNEFKIVEFSIGNSLFAINVSKVHRVINHEETAIIPNSDNCLEGVFDLRGENVVPLINLAQYLHLPKSNNPNNDKIIITEFNNIFTAFHVHKVDRIHLISWKDVEAPDAVTHSHKGIVSGIIRMEEKIILLLDFEKILLELSPSSAIEELSKDRANYNIRSDKKIILAEDSEMLRTRILDILDEAGYTNIIPFNNGQDAWEYINDSNNNSPDLIITDIEMPQMDGHRLTHLIKNESETPNIPVFIFSSLINDAMYRRGKELGANEQITKPQINKLVSLLDQYLIK